MMKNIIINYFDGVETLVFEMQATNIGLNLLDGSVFL